MSKSHNTNNSYVVGHFVIVVPYIPFKAYNVIVYDLHMLCIHSKFIRWQKERKKRTLHIFVNLN